MSFLEDRDPVRLGRDAREWLSQDETGRVIRRVVFSIAIAIAMSLLVTALVGCASRRRAAGTTGADDPEEVVAGEEPVEAPPVTPDATNRPSPPD